MAVRRKNRPRLTTQKPAPAAGDRSPNLIRKNSIRLIIAVVTLAATCGVAWLGLRALRNSSGTATPAESSGSSITPATPSAQRLATRVDQEFATKVNHGTELLAQGKPAEAIQVLEEAGKMNPNDEDVHYNLGVAYARQGQSAEAIKHYEEALRLYPDYVEAHNNLGSLLTRLGRTDEAVAHLERAVQTMPDYASAYNNLGTALQRAGRGKEALPHFRKATELNPEYWEAHFNLGTSHLEQGQISEAKSSFETVLKLRPGFEPAKLALAEMESRAR